jgi:hypothetical protein
MKRLVALTALSLLAALPLVAGDTPQAKSPAACCLKAAGASAERTVANLENGVKITCTASDAKAVAMIQKAAASCSKDKPCCKDCPMAAEGVTRTVEKTEKGVVITATSADAVMVKKLQESAAACCSGKMKACCKGDAHAKGAGHDCPHAATTDAKQS